TTMAAASGPAAAGFRGASGVAGVGSTEAFILQEAPQFTARARRASCGAPGRNRPGLPRPSPASPLEASLPGHVDRSSGAAGLAVSEVEELAPFQDGWSWRLARRLRA